MRCLTAPAVFAISVVFSAPLVASPTDSGRQLAECSAKLDSHTHAGLDNLRIVCPGLEQAITDLGLTPQLDENWRTTLGPEGLKDLESLTSRYQQAPAGPGPNIASLPPIERSVHMPKNPNGWWHRLMEWLQRLLQKKDHTSPSWLDQLMQRVSVPQLAQRVLYYGLLAALIAVTLWMIWRELKAAGVLSRKPQRPHVLRRGSFLHADATADVSIRELDAATLSDRPAVLLRLLVQALVCSGRISSERSLTHSELAQRGRFDSFDQRQRFLRVSRLAEQLLYGPAVSGATQQEIDHAVQEGRQLLDPLSVSCAVSGAT